MNDIPEGDLVLDGTWLCSGWSNVLPQQSTALHALVTTATDRDADGTLEELVAGIGWVWFDYFAGGLDCPVRWTHPCAADDPEEVAAGQEARTECLRAFSISGLVLPETVRDLAYTMAELGIFEVSPDRRRWRTVEWPPLPEEAIPVSDEFRAAEARRRWFKLQEPNAMLAAEVLPLDETVSTSIDELARVLELPEPAARGALEVLVHDRALTLTGPGGINVDPEAAASVERFDATLRYNPFGPWSAE